MGRRKKISEALISKQAEDDGAAIGQEEEEEGGGGKGRFFACYLLTSLCPRFKGQTYIGFTVNPKRRIRQHNGELRSGAWRTKRKRPWEMVLCIYGFPTSVAALQFEWAWQHPVESLAVRKAAATFKSLSGLANKIKLAYTMLTLPAWQSLNLMVNFFSTKYKKHTAACPSLPEHMRVQVCSMDELPCYTGSNWEMEEYGECDVDDDCERSGGSQESKDDGPVDAQGVNHFAGFQNRFEDYQLDKNDRTEETIHEGGGRVEETGLRQIRNSSVTEDTNWPLFLLNDHLVRASSLSVSSYNDIRNDAEERQIFSLVDECSIEDNQITTNLSQTTIVDNNDQPHSTSGEIEVIDVFTPSPCYKAGAGSKKRRLSAIYPEIIDLTESPIYV